MVPGGNGSDTFVFTDFANADTVTDFALGAGGDALNLHDVLPAAAQGQTTDGGLMAYLQVATVGASTVISVDADGGGGGAAVQVVTLEGVTGVTLQQLLNDSQIIT